METSLKFEEQTLDQTSDIWSLGCTILQFLLDTDTWNIVNFMKPDSNYNHGMKPLIYSVNEAAAHQTGWQRDGFNIAYY